MLAFSPLRMRCVPGGRVCESYFRGNSPPVPKRVLVIAASAIKPEEIGHQVEARFGPGAELRVVAPASVLSRIDWLTYAEDDARADTRARADRLVDALPGHDVEAEVGDTDPLQAVGDALAAFPPRRSW
jgi:hypothetical protein